jgi:hypothetical protein
MTHNLNQLPTKNELSVSTPFQNITNEMEKHGVLMDETLFRIEMLLDKIQLDTPKVSKVMENSPKNTTPTTFVEVVFNRLEQYNYLLERVQSVERRLNQIV